MGKIIWFITDDNQISSGELIESKNGEHLIGTFFGQGIKRVPNVFNSKIEARQYLESRKII